MARVDNTDNSRDSSPPLRHTDNLDASDDVHIADQATPEIGVPDVQASPEHAHRVLGGYKATLKNNNASDEAKAKASQFVHDHPELDAHQDGNGSSEHRTRASIQADADLDIDLKDKDPKRVIQGYKSAIRNPRTSDAKREHAEKAIEALEHLE